VPVVRAVDPSRVTVGLRRVGASSVPTRPPLADDGPILPLMNFGSCT
jgi:hypothetical protein